MEKIETKVVKPEISFIENDITNFELINYYKGRIYFSSNKYNWGEVFL